MEEKIQDAGVAVTASA